MPLGLVATHEPNEELVIGQDAALGERHGAERYLESKVGEALSAVRAAMTTLARSLVPPQLALRV